MLNQLPIEDNKYERTLMSSGLRRREKRRARKGVKSGAERGEGGGT